MKAKGEIAVHEFAAVGRHALARVKMILLTLLLAMALPIGTTVGADAYSGSAAAQYADQWALVPNSNWYQFSDDCTNFVSQAVFAGGFSMKGVGGSRTDDHNWFATQTFGYWTTSNSWAVSANYLNFLNWTYPGGWNWGTQPGYSGSVNSGLQVGDVLFFNWGQGQGISHVSFQVLVGYYTDANSGWVGDEVDQHTTNRYHAFWSLAPYNPLQSTTTITLMHVDSANH